MAKYRDQRGSLMESMETEIEVNSVEELKAHLNKNFQDQFGKSIAEVTFDYCGYDDRLDWDTWYVGVCFEGETTTYLAGMCNTNFE